MVRERLGSRATIRLQAAQETAVVIPRALARDSLVSFMFFHLPSLVFNYRGGTVVVGDVFLDIETIS